MVDKTSFLAQKLAELLRQRSLKVTCAESCTGGGVASAITSVGGSSAWFEYGFVTYANAAKQQLLNVAEKILLEDGAVSAAVVEQMAQGAIEAAGADIAVAISGIAGPEGGTEEKPVGTVWFCWLLATGEKELSCELFEGDRAEVRVAAIEKSLSGLLDILKKQDTV